MWNKPIKLFKGVDNVFDIQVQDFDQQPIPVRTYVIRFRAVDFNEIPVLSKELNFREGFTNRLALDISRHEIADLEPALYKWGLSIDDGEGLERPLYLEQNGATEGSLEISDWSYADDALVSAVLDTWTLDANTTNVTNDILSGVVTLDALTGSQLSPMHTIAVFKDAGADGKLTVEVSNNMTNATWATAYTITLTAGTTNSYNNFYGIYERLRFRFTPSIYSSGTIQTLYYRLF